MTKEKASEWLYKIVKYPTEDTIIELVSELEEQNTNLQEMLKIERSLHCKEEYLIRVVELEDKLANADYRLEGRDVTIKELEAQKKELQCCANCRYSYGGEEEPHHDCGYCHAMQCICKLKLEEHTSDIYRMWEDKCERWEMRVNQGDKRK